MGYNLTVNHRRENTTVFFSTVAWAGRRDARFAETNHKSLWQLFRECATQLVAVVKFNTVHFFTCMVGRHGDQCVCTMKESKV